jgi:NADH dehydrogenase FAD-containing subunit
LSLKKKRILILGAVFGGICTANLLRNNPTIALEGY